MTVEQEAPVVDSVGMGIVIVAAIGVFHSSYHYH